jgi:uncharacterized protein YecE (DUF72 family)
LKDPAQPLQNLLGRARGLGGHLGPIIYQLPPGWHCNIDMLRAFIGHLPADLEHVFEFRDPSWFQEPIRNLLVETHMNFCIHDFKGQSCPEWVTGGVIYLRFHRPSESAYAGRYHRRHLRRWAERIQEYRAAGKAAYAYFNNDAAGYAVANARELQELLAATPALA